MPTGFEAEVEALLTRSRRLGADRRITNFAGGNTSAKVTLADPVTGEPTACWWSRARAATSAP